MKIKILVFMINVLIFFFPWKGFAACNPSSQTCPKATGNIMSPPVTVNAAAGVPPIVDPANPNIRTCPDNYVLTQVGVEGHPEIASHDLLYSKDEGIGHVDCSGYFVTFYSWVFCNRGTGITQGARYIFTCLPLIQQRNVTWIATPF